MSRSTIQRASSFICTAFAVLVVGAFVAPIDSLIANAIRNDLHRPWIDIFTCTSSVLVLIALAIAFAPTADLARLTAAVFYPLFGAVMLLLANSRAGLTGGIAGAFLGLMCGEIAAIVHNNSQELLGHWLDKARQNYKFRGSTYTTVAGALFVATLYEFWFPWWQDGLFATTLLEAVFIYAQFAAAVAATLFFIYALDRTQGLMQIGAAAVAMVTVAETWLFVPRAIFHNYDYWRMFGTAIASAEVLQSALFTTVWILSIFAAACVYKLETSLESGLLVERTAGFPTDPTIDPAG